MTSALGGAIREKHRNQPNGFAGLDSNGDLLGTLINRSMTYSTLVEGVIPEVGELVYCTDTGDIHVGDGSTVGGLFVYSSPKDISTNGNLVINDANTHTLASYSVKANRFYSIRGSLGINDLETFNGFNNLKVVYQYGDANSGYSGGNARSTVPMWYVSGTVYFLAGTGTGSYQTQFNPPATTVVAPLQAFLFDLRVCNSTDATLLMEVARVDGVKVNPIQVGGSITIQRVT